MLPKDRTYRDAQAQKYLQPRTLELVKTYYPLRLRLKVLACCYAQLRGKYDHTCRSAYCPACSRIESLKIADAQYARFQACTPQGKPVRLAHEVYTLPPELRARLATSDGYAAWKDAVRATIREIHGADVAGVMNLHPHGDQDLTLFHPHMDVVLNGYLLDPPTGAIKEHRPPHVHPDDARVIYKRHLCRAFRLPPGTEPREVVLWIDGLPRRRGRFHTAKRKTRPMVRYSARNVYQPHLAWLNDHGTQGDWYYRPEEKRGKLYIFEGKDVIFNFTRIDESLRGRKRRSWFGYMQNRIIHQSARCFGHTHANRAPPRGEAAEEPE